MTGRAYMRYPLVIRPIAAPEYEALLTHCTGCDSCRAVPERECPRAGALRREWQSRRRQIVRAGRSR
ncbi:hypothetical protein OG266_39435 [Streptomyces sp. NBC_00554]|uniref:hypothetical protein n=1 Tax=Streptomyces sp. NBC_00554 TaxID=2903661 RepID=UPI00352DC4A6|nr:hypothetical protein OG266_39435 [Streptomyces sp. NBC_00554]